MSSFFQWLAGIPPLAQIPAKGRILLQFEKTQQVEDPFKNR